MVYSVTAERARRLEATGESWPFEYAGDTYELPYEVPQEFVDRMEELQSEPGTRGIRTLMQIAHGDRGDSSPFTAMSAPEIVALFQAYVQEASISLGESAGSPTSSASTATPSRPTSRPRTASSSQRSTKKARTA